MKAKPYIVKYKLSGEGLLGYFDGGSYCHIHSNELTKLEKWIHKLLRKK